MCCRWLHSRVKVISHFFFLSCCCSFIAYNKTSNKPKKKHCEFIFGTTSINKVIVSGIILNWSSFFFAFASTFNPGVGCSIGNFRFGNGFVLLHAEVCSVWIDYIVFKMDYHSRFVFFLQKKKNGEKKSNCSNSDHQTCIFIAIQIVV